MILVVHDFLANTRVSFCPALYLEKLGEDHFEEALGVMDNALVQMPR